MEACVENGWYLIDALLEKENSKKNNEKYNSG
jgi:hypothetical protein